jgi:hypothetical protein
VVAVLELAVDHVRDDLHVAVRVHAEAHARLDDVVVEHAQGAEAHVVDVVVVAERKVPAGVEPTRLHAMSLLGWDDLDHLLISYAADVLTNVVSTNITT